MITIYFMCCNIKITTNIFVYLLSVAWLPLSFILLRLSFSFSISARNDISCRSLCEWCSGRSHVGHFHGMSCCCLREPLNSMNDHFFTEYERRYRFSCTLFTWLDEFPSRQLSKTSANIYSEHQFRKLLPNWLLSHLFGGNFSFFPLEL